MEQTWCLKESALNLWPFGRTGLGSESLKGFGGRKGVLKPISKFSLVSIRPL
jgi:hypothetical protein